MKIIGHRGARGYFPENTLKGFKETVAMGVDGVELDVICSKDEQLLVSHNPFPDTRFSSFLRGRNYFQLDYTDIINVDVGSKRNPDYPEQVTFRSSIPTLEEVLRTISDLVESEFELFIEIKHANNRYYPQAGRYAQLLHDLLNRIEFTGVIIVKSFSAEFMNAFEKICQGQALLSYLIEEVDEALSYRKKLNFNPYSVNVRHDLLNIRLAEVLRDQKIYVWTVNELADVERIKNFNLEGIITDYPRKMRLSRLNTPK